MPATWFIGDLHFGHEKIAQLRGFDDVDAHDTMIRRQWVRQVRAGDVVWVLGDISSGGTAGEILALDYLTALPGRKRLIAGNHDSVSGVHRSPSPRTRLFRDVFETINDYGRIRIDREQVYLSHYPYASQGDGPGRGLGRYMEYRMPDLGGRLIHAHTHYDHPTSGSVTDRELCVSWDAWGRLVNLGDVQKWIDS